MSFHQSLRLKRGIFWRTHSSRLPLYSTPLPWNRLGLRQEICPSSSHTSKPRPLPHKVDDRDHPVHQAAEVLLGSFLVHHHRSAHPPLSDSSLLRREMLASIRNLPEPLRSGGVFGSRSLVPHRRLAAAQPAVGWLGRLGEWTLG